MTVRVFPTEPNFIIGGDFHTNPWQRGTNFVSPLSGDYMADRFQYRSVGTHTYTFSQDLSAPAPSETQLFFLQSMKSVVTTANAAPAAVDFSTIEQPIEAFISLPAYNERFFMDFWVFTTTPGIYCIAFQNDSRTRSFVTEYTISLANTWQNITFSIPVDAAVGTWETGSLTGIRVIFTLNTGVNSQTTPDVWTGGNFLSTVNQTNLAGSINNEFHLALVYGSHRSSNGNWAVLSQGKVLNLCQRYYEKSYNIDIDPGTITQVGASVSFDGADTEIRGLQNRLVVNKRGTPTMTWYSPDTGAIGNIFRANVPEDRAVVSSKGNGESSTGWPIIGASVGTDWEGHWTAESEL